MHMHPTNRSSLMNTPHTKSKTKKQSVSLSALYMVWPHCLTVELTTLSSAVYRKTNLKSINHCATVHTSSLHDAVNLRACYVAWFSLLRLQMTMSCQSTVSWRKWRNSLQLNLPWFGNIQCLIYILYTILIYIKHYMSANQEWIHTHIHTRTRTRTTKQPYI